MSVSFEQEPGNAVDEIFYIERSAKADFYSEDNYVSADEVLNYISEISLPALRLAFNDEENTDQIVGLLEEAREWRDERGLENDEDFYWSPHAALNPVFYREIEENTEQRVDGVIGIDKKGSPFAQGAAVYFDVPIFFCNHDKTKNQGEQKVEWLTEKPEEGHYLLIDDVRERGFTIGDVRNNLPYEVTTKTAVKEQRVTMHETRETNVVY